MVLENDMGSGISVAFRMQGIWRYTVCVSRDSIDYGDSICYRWYGFSVSLVNLKISELGVPNQPLTPPPTYLPAKNSTDDVLIHRVLYLYKDTHTMMSSKDDENAKHSFISETEFECKFKWFERCVDTKHQVWQAYESDENRKLLKGLANGRRT